MNKNRLASSATAALLLLSGMFAIFTIVPISSVHAASAAMTVSPTSGGIGTRLTITATGFTPGAPLDIYFDTRQTTPYSTVLSPSTTSTTSGIASLISTQTSDSNPSTGTACSTTACYEADADGNFQLARQRVPYLAGGAHTLVVTDGTNKVSTTFTMTSSVTVRVYQSSCALSSTGSTLHSLSSGFADQSWTTACVAAYGFSPGETVSFSASGIFTTATVPASCTAGTSSSANPGACVSSTTTLTFGVFAGGAKTFTATGSSATGCGSAACTASKTITISPAIAFYSSQTSTTQFSFLGTVPTAIFIEGYGFAASTTIAANSATVGGVSTTHGAITSSSTGTFGLGDGNFITIAPTASVPFGPASFVIGGTTFNYANGNIILPKTTDSATTQLVSTDSCTTVRLDASCSSNTASTSFYGNTAKTAVGIGWGAPLISSTAPTTAGTAVFTTDSSSYYPNYGSNSYNSNNAGNAASLSVVLFGYGAVAGTALGTTTAPASLTYGATITSDAQGAAWAVSTNSLGDTAVTSTSQSFSFTMTGATGASTVLAPSFTVKPWVYLTTGSSLNPDAINFNSGASQLTVEAHGFQASLSTTVSVDGSSVTTSTSTTGASGAFTGVTITTTPDLAYGSHTVAVTDGTYSASDSTFTLPAVAATTPGTSTGAALSSDSGAAGSTTTLRTGTGYGVHGLKATTTYSLYWGLTATTAITTFTTDSKGKIAAPGASFTVPAGTVGNHILVIKDSTGTDVLFNSIANGDGGAPVGSSSVGSATYQSSLSASLTGQYMDLLFSLSASLSVVPTVGNVGTTITISGSGLSPATSYYASAKQASSCVTTTAGSTSYATFTSDSSGNIPASTSFAFPALPTVGTTSGTYPEQGTTYCVYASTAAQLQAVTSSAAGTFVLQSLVTLSASSGTAGTSVTLTATGLIASATYAIVWNYGVNPQATAYTGTQVGAFTANSVTGGGSLAFTVPSTAAAGAYTVQLARLAGGPGSSALGVLASAPTFTVTAGTTGGTTLSSSTLTAASTTATEGPVNGQATISQTYTNTFGSSLSVYMWVSVMNAAGQTVNVYLGSATIAAGGSTTIAAALFNLPSGSYTASVFVTTTTGVVVSGTSTTASFTV